MKFRFVCICFCVSFFVAACSSSEGISVSPVQISVDNGKLTCRHDDNVIACLGIPFAAPPVGALRWKAPQPHQPVGNYDATYFRPRCSQVANPQFGSAASESEDCLYLNVYTPTSGQGPFPVMLWIHGGSWTLGAGSDYDGQQLAEKGQVVVVTINYRLGPLGYLAHPGLSAEDPNGSSGNYGLKDQIMAMRWVQSQISHFQGNPSNVTIVGESAGSFSVCNHIASPVSAGLFHRAIMESGPCISIVPQFRHVDAESLGSTFAVTQGCAQVSAADQITCLRGKSVSQLLSQGLPGPIDLRFIPNTDGYVLPKNFSDAVTSGQYNHVPMLLGINHEEGRFFVAASLYSAASTSESKTAAEIVQSLLPATPEVNAVVSNILSTLNLSGSSTGQPDNGPATEQPLLIASKVFGDLTFACAAEVTSRALAGNSAGLYIYEFNDPHSPVPGDIANFPYLTMHNTHTSELVYVFQATVEDGKTNPSLLNAEQLQLSDRIIGYWSSFAHDGVPTATGAPKWPSFGMSSLQRLSPAPDGIATIGIDSFVSDHQCLIWSPVIKGFSGGMSAL